MNVEQYSEEAIFKAAIKMQSPAERTAYVKRACGSDANLFVRLDTLLRAHDSAGDFLETPPFAPADALDIPPVEEGPGTAIGRYKLLERIGEGGMAVVYMTEQERPIRRKVALKIIKLGMDTKQVIARFEAERQALALMDHPSIAKVLDAGATDTGRPYFVMELVTGISITEYCDRNSLSTKDRLGLFIQVCHAVQHAHQKGIIHRDIKPSNVMVTHHDGKPTPKVIDFGIAKATNQRLTEKTLFTRYAHIIGTPAYMSPEQAELSDVDIDTRSDIYSLGVLLYELLTSTTPFSEEELRKAGYSEMQRVIREQEPAKPSTKLSTLGETLTDIAKQRGCSPDLLRRTLRGDLDWIAMKSLQKDRTRRYDSTSALLDDIKRHLNHEPVSAGPPSAWYRTTKFLQRHRILVLAVTVIVVTIVTGLGTSTTMYVRAERARAETQSVTDFLTNDLLASVYPEKAKSQEVTVRYILQIASENLENKFVNSPLCDAAIRRTIGLTYQKMGDYQTAGPYLEQVLETRRRVLGEEHPDTLQSMCDLSWQCIFQGRSDEAEGPALQAFETGRRVLGREHTVVLSAMECCAFMYLIGDRRQKAEPIAFEGYEISRRVLGEEHERTVFFMNQLAWLYEMQKRHDAAMGMAVRAFEIARRVLGQEHPNTLQAMNQLGRAYTIEGRLDEAEALLARSVELSRDVLGEGHLFTLFYTARLASLYEVQKQHEKMEETLATALKIAQRIPGELLVTNYLYWRLHQRITALSAATSERYDAGEYAKTVEMLARQEELRRSLAPEHAEMAPSDVALLATSLHYLGRDQEALTALHRLREMFEQGQYMHEEHCLYEVEQLFADEERHVCETWALMQEGKLDAACEAIEGARTPPQESAPAAPESEQSLLKALARAYCIRGIHAEGRGEYEEAIRDYEAAIQENLGLARAHDRLARLLAICQLDEVRDGVRGIEHATQACELTKWENPSFISTLAAAHAEVGDFRLAVECQKQAIDLLKEDKREQLLPNYETRLRLYEAGKPYRRSMLAWWTFEESNSQLVMDSSGNDFHGQLVGDAHVIEDADRPGKVLCLDGDGDWVDCGNDASFNMESEITVACWIRVQEFDKKHQSIISKGGYGWGLGRFDVSDQLSFGCSGVTVPSNMYGVVIGKANVNDAQWHHVVGLYDGTAIYLYVDGRLDASSEASGRIDSDSYKVLIGEDDRHRSDWGRDRSFNGLLDDVRIYNYAMAEAEIEAVYSGKEAVMAER